MTIDHPSITHRTCPSDEFLAAVATGCVSSDEQHWLDIHLDSCDRCLDAVDAVLRRLRIADEIPVPVPHAVQQRATAAAIVPEPAAAILAGPRPATVRPATAWWAEARGWVAALLRPPVMIPAAAGIVAVLVVASQTWVTTGAPRPLTRSIAVSQQARVTAREAVVRRQPNGHAEVVATVTRGMMVGISGEERDWSHVTLPNGTEGWVDQEALR